MKMTEELSMMMDILRECSIKYYGPVVGDALVAPFGNAGSTLEYRMMLYGEYVTRYDEEPSDACLEIVCAHVDAWLFSQGKVVTLEQTLEDGRVLRIHSHGNDMPHLELIEVP
jgi:hypothetical protein